MTNSINEKRHSPRMIIREEKAIVEISLNYPKGSKIVKEVIDLSDSGFSLRMPAEEGYLAKGTPLKEIVLNYNDIRYPVSGEVAYVVRLETGEGLDYKMGVQLSKNVNWENKSDALPRYQFRPRRYDYKFLAKLGGILLYSDKNIEIVGEIVDISSFGAAFKVRKDVVLKQSQVLNSIKIIFRDETLYSGSAVIINIRETSGEMIIGVSFQNVFGNIGNIIDLRSRQDIKDDLEQFIESLRYVDQIDEKFKSEVTEMKYYLEEIEEKIIEQEKKMKNFDLEKHRLVEGDVLSIFQEDLKKRMDQFCESLYSIVKNHSSAEHALNKYFFQKNLHPFLLQSPYLERAYKKPLGYAGDYEIINMILRFGYEGNTLFGKLIHYYAVSIPPAQAHRNRINYLENKMIRLFSQNKPKDNVFKITSLGCGPAIEMQEVLLYLRDHPENIEITLIDFDEHALNYVQESLFNFQKSIKSDVKIKYLEISIRELLRTKEIRGLPPQDIIYCTGLLDYLSDAVSARLIEILYENVSDEGKLIIGNISEPNHFRYAVEYSTDWYLNHRTPADFQALLSGAINKGMVSEEKEETGLNIFLDVKKD